MTALDKAGLVALADCVEALADSSSNSLDVLCEVAMFKPCAEYVAVRSNSAGTKVIYTTASGGDETCWAMDWTHFERRQITAATLRALAGQP